MNRQTKRLMQKQGSDKPRAADRKTRPQPGSDVKREKIGPRAYLAEVRAELKKVAWPNRKEVINSTIVVLIAVVFMGALIFAYDYLASRFVLQLFD